MKDHIKLSIPKKPEYVSLVRLTSSAIANRIGFNIEEIDDIKVAIAEACTHVIQKSTTEEDDNFSIEFYIEKKELSILVVDKGSRNKDDLMGHKDVSDLNKNGLGLFIIESLMDDVIYSEKDDQLEIKMCKRIGVGG